MPDLKLTAKRLGMHWHYYRIWYVVLIAVALVGSNLLLSITTPKTPANRKVEIILIPNVYSSDAVDALQQNLLCALPPDQKEVNILTTPLYAGQEAAIYQMVAARMSAGEGNIWILPVDMYASYASSGAFIPLEDVLNEFPLPQGFDASAAKVTVQAGDTGAGEQHICGIPLDKITGLSSYIMPDGMVLAFPSFMTENYDNARLVADYLLTLPENGMESFIAHEGSFGFYVAANYTDPSGVAAWRKAIEAGTDFQPEMPGVFLIPYQTGRAGEAAKIIAARTQNYASGMCMVSREVFTILARQGALMPLDGVTGELKLPEGIDLSAGRETAVAKRGAAPVEGLYGIPLDSFPGLSTVFNPKGMLLVFPVQGSDALNAAIGAANVLLEPAGAAK